MPQLQIRTLGTLQVIRDGQPVAESDWHTRQARQLLKILITERPRPVATDRLIEILWPHSTPAAAATTLRSAINALRNVLEPRRASRAPSRFIHTQTPGYAFRPSAEVWLDVAAFEDALQSAQNAPDLELRRLSLAEALALYADDYLTSDPYADWAKAERERLQELFFTALLQMAELHARAGDYATAISTSRRILARDEVREHAYQALMCYQAESGDSAGALLSYERCRTLLAEELGADPSPLTQQLHQQILNGNIQLRPALPMAAVPWLEQEPTDRSAATAPSPTGTTVGGLPQEALLPRLDDLPGGIFIGREEEMAQLLVNLDASLAGQGQMLVIEGEVGVGKTRLAYEVLQQAVERGATVISATCQALEQQLPFAPLADGIGRYLDQLPVSSLRHLSRSSLAQLTQIIPSVQDRLPNLAEPPGDLQTSSEENRQRLVDGIASFLTTLARLRPLVLLLDDLHWADGDTIAVLSRLSQRAHKLPILVMLAYRSGELAENSHLVTLLRALHRSKASLSMPLQRLSREHVQRLVGRLTGDQTEESISLANSLYAVTLGNALFLAEAVRAMQELCQEAAERHVKPTILHVWHSSNGRSLGLWRSQRVQEIIQERVERLPPPALEVLYLSAVIGRDFSLDLLEKGSPQDPMAGLEILLRRQFLIERPDGRLDYSHQVVRQVAYDSLSGLHRRRLHRQVAEAMVALQRAEESPSETAFHFGQAGQAATAPFALYSTLAGEQLLGTYGFRQAVRHFDTALALLESRSDADSDLISRALRGRGLAYEGLLDPDGVTDTYRRLRLWAGRRGDQALMLRTHNRLISILGLVGQQRESNALMQELLQTMGPSNVPAIADLVRRHRLLYSPEPVPEPASWSPLQPPPPIPGDPVADITQLLEPVHAVLPLWEYGWTLRIQGQLTMAGRCLHAAADLALETAQLSIASMAFHQLAVLATMQGQETESQSLNRRSIDLNRRAPGSAAELVSLWPRISSAFHALDQGNLDEAQRRLQRVMHILDDRDAFRNHRNSANICQGLVALALEEWEAAHLLLEASLADAVNLYPYTHVRALLGLAEIAHHRLQQAECDRLLQVALGFAGRRSLVEEYGTSLLTAARLYPRATPLQWLLGDTLDHARALGFASMVPRLQAALQHAPVKGRASA